jgi:hypothetical protein
VPKGSLFAVSVVSLTVLLVSLAPWPTPRPEPRHLIDPAATGYPDPHVAVDPASWWMDSGSNVTLGASWGGTPPGCTLEPTWFRWSIAPVGSEGTLGATNGSSVTFSAVASTSGTTVVMVRSAAVLQCVGSGTSEGSFATSNVTVAAPLAVGELSAEPNPVPPGASVALTGQIVGGTSPYAVRVAWGDGHITNVTVSRAGRFSAPYAYETNGSYLPEAFVTDAAGSRAAALASERENVSAGFVAAIKPSSVVAEVGVPVSFAVRLLDPPRNFSVQFGCENSGSLLSTNATGLDYDCAFDQPLPSYVSFEAVGARIPFPVAYASLEEAVVARPSIVLGPTSLGEVGDALYVGLSVAGGVPPFTLRWALVGTGANGSFAVPGDGRSLLPLSSPLAGAFNLSAVVVDGLDQESLPASEDVAFLPPLALSAAAVAVAAPRGIRLNVSADALGGVPPYDWTIVPSTGVRNGSSPSGALAGSGGFAWNATCRREGAVAITVDLVDADGGWRSANLTVLAVPVLSAAATVEPAGSGRVRLELTIYGGVGPYAYHWSDAAGSVWNGSVDGPGTVALTEQVAGSGPLNFTVEVADALGAVATATANASVPPAADPVAPVQSVPVGLVLAGLLGAGALGALGLRRHGRARADVPPAPPDPVAILREVIEPSDGVDRALVEMLAEERGLAPGVVHETLERLKADGKVRAGRGFDGEEVFAWVEDPAP